MPSSWRREPKCLGHATRSRALLTRPPDLIVLVLLSLLITAAVAYLPNHLIVISNRLWYYVQGETLELTSTKSGGQTGSVLDAARSVVSGSSTEAAKQTAEEVVRQLHEL